MGEEYEASSGDEELGRKLAPLSSGDEGKVKR